MGLETPEEIQGQMRALDKRADALQAELDALRAERRALGVAYGAATIQVEEDARILRLLQAQAFDEIITPDVWPAIREHFPQGRPWVESTQYLLDLAGRRYVLPEEALQWVAGLLAHGIPGIAGAAAWVLLRCGGPRGRELVEEASRRTGPRRLPYRPVVMDMLDLATRGPEVMDVGSLRRRLSYYHSRREELQSEVRVVDNDLDSLAVVLAATEMALEGDAG